MDNGKGKGRDMIPENVKNRISTTINGELHYQDAESVRFGGLLTAELKDEISKLLDIIQGSRTASIGGLNNVYVAQISKKRVDKLAKMIGS